MSSKNGTLPSEIWLYIFQFLPQLDTISCALVCTDWCLLVQSLIPDKAAREIIHPYSSTQLLRAQMNRAWLQGCLIFTSSRKIQYSIEELGIQGLNYAHLSALQEALQVIGPNLKRINFTDALVPLEKLATVILYTCSQLSAISLIYPDSGGFTRRTLGEIRFKEGSMFRHLTYIRLRLRDLGFERDTNTYNVKQLIGMSPNLTHIILDPFTSLGHEEIFRYCTHTLKKLRLLTMTDEQTADTILAEPMHIPAHGKRQKKSSGLKVLAVTEKYTVNSWATRIPGRGVQDNRHSLEKLYFRNLYPAKVVSWPSLLVHQFPNLRCLNLHIGRGTGKTIISTSNLEENICLVLSHAPLLETFVYHRDMPMIFNERKTRVTDTVLDTLLQRHYSELSTFHVVGGHQFSARKLHEFITTYSRQLSRLGFDCSIGIDCVSFITETVASLKYFTLQHVEDGVCPSLGRDYNPTGTAVEDLTFEFTRWPPVEQIHHFDRP
ncbi:hypothetical protein BJV82DRAFT_657956 [Fennellomyces sp. T-0311]|nr:hypothetical protein BJV82DRAFT_657956 [Fennellomyces sp. T-0311]